MRLIKNVALRRIAKRLVDCGLILGALSACDTGFEQPPGSGDGNGGGGGGGGGGGSDTSSPFIGAGPMWELSFGSGNSFDLNVRRRPGGDLVNDIAGQRQDLASGFSRLTVNNTVGSGGPATNTQLSALAIGEEMLFVEDWANAGQLVPLVPGNDCPDEAISANWIQWRTPGTALATDEELGFFGAMNFDPENEELAIDPSFSLAENFPALAPADPLVSGNCVNGVARDTQNHTFFGDNGLVISHQNVGTDNETMWIGLPQESLSAADLDGEYIGVWTDQRPGVSSDATWYVTLSCSNNGECEGQRISDVGNLNSFTNESFRIELDNEAFDNPWEGMVTGVVEDQDPVTQQMYESRIACTASDSFSGTGDKVLACVGQSPLDTRYTVNGFFIAEE